MIIQLFSGFLIKLSHRIVIFTFFNRNPFIINCLHFSHPTVIESKRTGPSS